MNLTLRDDIQRFIEERVKAGQFPTAESVIEAAIADMRDVEDAELDEDTIAAINEAEAHADLGAGMDLDAFRAHMDRRVAGL
jgi:Arc/MetJ-type ribon-helix-helix transcriptional regulator